MSGPDLVEGLAGFATLHPLFAFGPLIAAGWLLVALARRAHLGSVARR